MLNDSQMKDVMSLTIYMLVSGLVAFYLLSIDLMRELGYYGNEILYVVLFLSFVASALSIMKGSKIFFQSYAHVGNEAIGKKLLYGYAVFFFLPMVLLVLLGDSIGELLLVLFFVAIGFYSWNFVSDTIMDYLCYTKVRNLQYTIGSDIATSRDALAQVKKLLVWRLFVFIIVGFLFMGIFAFVDYNAVTYFTVVPLGLIFPAFSMSMVQRLKLVEALLKIPISSLDKVQNSIKLFDIDDEEHAAEKPTHVIE